MNKRNTLNRSERLLDAAATLICRLGYDKTTISDIAAKAGVAKGAVYLHWSSKQALFDSLIIREMKNTMEDMLHRVEADPRGGSLARMYTHSLMALKANPLMCALYAQDSRILGDYIHRQNTNRYTERFGFGNLFIETLQHAGLVRQGLDPASVSYVMSIIAYGFTSIESIIPAEQAPPMEQIAQVLETWMLQGIALEEGDMEISKQALRQGVAMINQQYQALTPDQPMQKKEDQ